MAEVDERVRRHCALTEQVAELSQQRIAAGPRLSAAQAAAGRIAELTNQAREAKLIADAAVATSAAATAAHDGRVRLLTEIETRTATVAAAEAEAQQAAVALSAARAVAEASAAAVAEANQVLTDLHHRAESARRTVDRLADREEAGRLSARLAKVAAIQRDSDRLGAELSTIAVTEESLRRIEDAAAAVDRIGGQLALMSAGVEFTAAADIELAAGDQRVSLAAGQSWSITATGPTTVEVPGVLTARVTPGATTLDIQAKYAAAQQELTAALAAADVADLAAARSADQRRRELQGSRDQLTATVAGLCGDEQIDELRSRLAQLRAGQPDEPDPMMDIIAARAELDAAEAARAAATAECETCRQAAAAADAGLAELSTSATVLQNKLETQRSELDAATDRLAQERALVGDEDLASAADAGRQAAENAERRVTELTDELAAAAPDAVAAELTDCRRGSEFVARAVRRRRGCIARDQHRTLGHRQRGSPRQTRHRGDGTRTRRRPAHPGGRPGPGRAAAALGDDTPPRHHQAALRRAVPRRTAAARPPGVRADFEVDIDSDLCIRSRTLDGVTVPYESLSGGAKEQLGILARLAGAALVTKEDTVPVVVDDALGFTDPDRLAKMGEVFDTVGAHGQVIVLTCSPDRYDGVKGAHRIDLDD